MGIYQWLITIWKIFVTYVCRVALFNIVIALCELKRKQKKNDHQH